MTPVTGSAATQAPRCEEAGVITLLLHGRRCVRINVCRLLAAKKKIELTLVGFIMEEFQALFKEGDLDSSVPFFIEILDYRPDSNKHKVQSIPYSENIYIISRIMRKSMQN